MNPNLVKTRKGDLFEVHHVVHRAIGAPAGTPDVLACYRISTHDGMPIGSQVWISVGDLVDEDQIRFGSRELERSAGEEV